MKTNILKQVANYISNGLTKKGSENGLFEQLGIPLKALEDEERKLYNFFRKYAESGMQDKSYEDEEHILLAFDGGSVDRKPPRLPKKPVNGLPKTMRKLKVLLKRPKKEVKNW